MYLVSRFRQVSFVRGPRMRLVSIPAALEARYPEGARLESPPAAGAQRPQLQCRWDEAQRSDVCLGGERFRGSDMLMHWMPVH